MLLPKFNNPQLLTTALTHRSALNEHLSDSSVSNERLEFLGDAVLELIITEYLYHTYPDQAEGVLTAYRSALVKTTTLAEVATELELGKQLFMSKGEESSGGRTNIGLLANVTEAVIGALYLDQGLPACQRLIAKFLVPRLPEIIAKQLYKDPKSLLQEMAQARAWGAPEYQVISESGPDHNRQFSIKVLVNGEVVGEGTGRSKQAAQEAAAKVALVKFSPPPKSSSS